MKCPSKHGTGLQCLRRLDKHKGKNPWHLGASLNAEGEIAIWEWRHENTELIPGPDGSELTLYDSSMAQEPKWAPGQLADVALTIVEKNLVTDMAERNACWEAMLAWARRHAGADGVHILIFDWLQGWISHCNHDDLDDAQEARTHVGNAGALLWDRVAFAEGHCARANWKAGGRAQP